MHGVSKLTLTTTAALLFNYFINFNNIMRSLLLQSKQSDVNFYISLEMSAFNLL